MKNYVPNFEEFLNEGNDPKADAYSVIGFWVDGGFQETDLKNSGFLKKAIKDYEIAMGTKVHPETSDELVMIVNQ